MDIYDTESNLSPCAAEMDTSFPQDLIVTFYLPSKSFDEIPSLYP
jgi:hypothetical protein